MNNERNQSEGFIRSDGQMTVSRGDPDNDKYKRGGISSRSVGRLIECQSFNGSAMSRMSVECARGYESQIWSDRNPLEQNIDPGMGYDSAGQVRVRKKSNPEAGVKTKSMVKNKNGPIEGRASGDPPVLPEVRGHPLLLFSSRGDPPHWYGSRGRPMLLLKIRGHPPQRFSARGDPPEYRNFRDGPLAEYAARGKPPEKNLTGQNWPDGRGMGGREGNYNADRSGDAVRFEKEKHRFGSSDLSACSREFGTDSVSKDELNEKYYGT